MNLIKERSKIAIHIYAFLAAAALMFGLYLVKGYAPFGNNSLACMDANIDYLDFLANLKDALEGRASFIYSFSKGIGGNMFGVFASGYFSPVNLLLLLFDKSQLHTFFDVAVAVKIGLSSLTMSYFLRKRFVLLRDELILTFSVCYGLCQYNLVQASNIFFLDGTCTLPLFLLGTYYIVNKRKPYLLIAIVAVTVMFNWYMGGINCIYTAFWALFESVWRRETEGVSIKECCGGIIKTAVAGLTGVLLSCIVFIPSIVALQKSSEGSLDLMLFKDSNYFLGNIITVITDYYWGATSSIECVALFCGAISLVGCIAFFISERFNNRQKLTVGGLIIITVLMYYWYPLYLVFSLFKYVGSFWSRYGYIGSFLMIFVAGLFFSELGEEKNLKSKLTVSAAAVSVIMLVYYRDADVTGLKWIYATLFGICVITLLINILLDGTYRERTKRAAIWSIVVFSALEMWCNAWLLMNIVHQKDVDKYKDYMSQAKKQLESIKTMDQGYYRISQTRTRFMQEGNLTANYDEAHSLGYWGIASYTSVPDDLTREFLDRSGYRINGEDMYIVNYPLLPVDSFLGVRYVLSDKSIPGMIRTDKIESANKKDVYVNPYAIPMAFTTDVSEYTGDLNYSDLEASTGKESQINPFMYQNDLYSRLTGEKTELYIPLEYKRKNIAKDEVEFSLTIPDGNYILYGNLPWKKERKEVIHVNDEMLTYYSRWGSPSVFPINSDTDVIKVKVTGEKKVSIADEQFYALDLDALGRAVKTAKEHELSDYTIKDGYFTANVSSERSERLITSIPYEPQWEVTVNGEKVEPDIFADTFISVPIEKGDNHIEFKYHAGGFSLGIAFTLAGLLLLVCNIIIEHRKTRKEEK